MKEFPLNKGRFALVDDDIYEKLIALGYKWHVSRFGYAIRFNGRKCQWLHRFVTDCPAGLEVDHIDRNRLNNQRSNLRLCNKVQNQGNRPGSRKTGFKGVIHRMRNKHRKWEAYITKGGKCHSLGCFSDQIEAAKAYDSAAREHFGEFALVNLP